MNINEIVKQVVDRRASDIHIKPGARPFVRVKGELWELDLPVVTPADSEALANEILPQDKVEDFKADYETNFGLGVPNVGRFRISVLRQRGSVSLAMRRLPTTPPDFAALGLPARLAEIAERRRGLVLITGPTDSGKSTTVGAFLNEVNEKRSANIITIEDPIEMLFADKKSFIIQRELGTDARTIADAITQSMRHDPDVLYVDGVTDEKVMQAVLKAASACLVITTLPALDAQEAVDSVVELFPPRIETQIRRGLASVLECVISQRLLSRADGQGRVAAFEVLIMTPRVHPVVAGTTTNDTLGALMAAGEYNGMQTMDQQLIRLYAKGLITQQEAISASGNPQDLRIELQRAVPE